MFRKIVIGDVVKMRKAHPCGGFEWKIVRLGADIGLICLKCQHRIMLSRRDLEHRAKSIMPGEGHSENVES
jgi:hypothetical protein